MPKKANDSQYVTPIKKWKKTSPFQEDLAIIESDDSDCPQLQLFSALVDDVFPILQVQQPSLGMQPFQEQLSDPFFSHSDCNSQQSNHILDTHKINLPLTSQKAPLQTIDTNRRGCKCQKSKCNKKYCDCLRYGLTCAEGVCACQNCNNREQKQVHREIFNKLSKLQTQKQKGCHCKKSKCHKKYCECHSSGRKCGKSCECIDCENMGSPGLTKYDKMYKLVKIQCLNDN